jgi:hypothetical protein
MHRSGWSSRAASAVSGTTAVAPCRSTSLADFGTFPQLFLLGTNYVFLRLVLDPERLCPPLRGLVSYDTTAHRAIRYVPMLS